MSLNKVCYVFRCMVIILRWRRLVNVRSNDHGDPSLPSRFKVTYSMKARIWKSYPYVHVEFAIYNCSLQTLRCHSTGTRGELLDSLRRNAAVVRRASLPYLIGRRNKHRIGHNALGKVSSKKGCLKRVFRTILATILDS